MQLMGDTLHLHDVGVPIGNAGAHVEIFFRVN